ncbi:hypothetical protein J1N35_041284 [Gossypium stocksii]|uniref:Endonuclease/exonuclease/phosphatase domain-containing protein n=1 Tax=Gossypium stocksii TaxID=47602 RepID=A0A9D3UFF9_9ROSI|nr:hypothetical protein J1N35_041284 [Gossypium stocksii]
MGLLIGKASFAQNQAPKAGVSIKAICQTGLMMGRTSVASLTMSKQAELDKQEKPNNVSIGQQFKSLCLKAVCSDVINFHNSMDDTDPSVGGNFHSLASDHVKEGFSNLINNQEQHLVHFNPTFEGSSAINVAVKKGVLEDKNHSAIVFKHSSMLESGSKISRGNGCASDKFLRVFREYRNLHKPDIISLLEPRISGFKADTIIIGWKSSVDLKVVVNHPQFILVRIYSKLHSHPIFVAFVYGSPDKLKRKFLWKDLSHTVPRGFVLWMAIGDFNDILSLEDKKGGHVKGRRCKFFGEFMDNAFSHDLGFQGAPFTWHQGALSERLDRAVGNEA